LHSVIAGLAQGQNIFFSEMVKILAVEKLKDLGVPDVLLQEDIREFRY
jgi:hypothetical protein